MINEVDGEAIISARLSGEPERKIADDGRPAA
jgi:hypothetical protein